MREIKFRGKRKDTGEWVYGYYFISERDIEDGFVWRDIPQIQQRYGDHFQYFDVDLATVGQYTGLHDKNGKEIYEGDIVLAPCAPCGKDKRSIKPHRCEVFWSQMGIPGWDLRILDYEPGVKWARGHLCLGREGDAFEVIGNIHDNPELLEEVIAKAREGNGNA